MHFVKAAGARIPALGFGTFELRGAQARAMTRTALELGYRHIDTARMYFNEDGIGQGIADAGIERSELFLTTKVWPDDSRNGDLQRSLATSLEQLGTDYVDLLLLHWPSPVVPLDETLAALNEVRDAGLVRDIGISNFNVALVRQAARLSRAPLATNQVEYHPFLNQDAVWRAAREEGMALTAYSPLAQGAVFHEPVIVRIAGAHGRTPGQVALRWLVQQDGVVAIPKASSAKHARENLAIFDFELDDDEMTDIHRLTVAGKRIIDFPGYSPKWD